MAKPGRKPIPIEQRFWAKVEKTDTCWLWQGNVWHCGYGTIWRDGESKYAHRIAYELQNGPVPDGIHVCHRCDNPLCVRGDHLFLGTLHDNMKDKFQKRRHAKGERHGNSRLKSEDIREIISLVEAGSTQAEVARKYGVDQSHVSRIVGGDSWSHLERR